MKKNFSIGLFAFNASSGVTLTKQRNRWNPNFDLIKKVAIVCEKNKFDFLLPIARWNDWSGDTNPHRNTYETISLMSSLASITKNIKIYSTIHLPFTNPIFAARASVTMNHISNGRFGLNLVCGWNKAEFEMFNVSTKISSINRYQYAEEWLRAYKKLIYSNKKINFNGKFIKFKNGQCFPKLLNGTKINFISAAFSDNGRKFATKNCDILFTMFSKLETLKKNNKILRLEAKKQNKKVLIYSPIHIICKKSRIEAEDFYQKYSKKNADLKAVDNFISNLAWAKKDKLSLYLKQVKQKVAGSLGHYTIIGNSNDCIEQLEQIYKSDINGIALTFYDCLNDTKNFCNKVLPKVRKF